jgi:hypothetical protein
MGVADPFVWLQLIDDRGAPVTEEACLGHGIDLECRIHARAPLGIRSSVMLAAPLAGRPMATVPIVREATVRGLYARLLLRTYGSETGPRYQTEAVVIPLLEPGHRVRLHIPPVQASAGDPSDDGLRAVAGGPRPLE